MQNVQMAYLGLCVQTIVWYVSTFIFPHHHDESSGATQRPTA